MHDPAIERIVDELLMNNAAETDRNDLRSMLHYLGRCSLPVLRLETRGDRPCVICGEVDQFRLTVAQLLSLWRGMRAGTAIDWQALPTLPAE